jgi:hypothetical protein
MSQTHTPKLVPVVAGVLLALLVVGTAAGAVATTVWLDPATETLTEGDRTTVDVVVEEVDGGVGAYAAELSVEDGEVARIADVTLHGTPDLRNVTVSEDGSAVSIKAALMQTADTGDVAVASVTLEGQGAGTTGVSLSVTALGDRDGNSYAVAGTEDATLSVRETEHDPPALPDETPTAGSSDQSVAAETPTPSTGSAGSADDGGATPERSDGPPSTPAASSDTSDGGTGDASDSSDPTASGTEPRTPSGPGTLFVVGVGLAALVAAGLLVLRRR